MKTSTGKPLVYRDAFLVEQADNSPEIMFAPFLDSHKINLNGYCCLSVDVNRKTTLGDPIFWSVIRDKNWPSTTYSNEQQVDTNTGTLKSVKVPLVTDISLSWHPILVDWLDHTPPLAIGLYGSIIDQDSITRTSLGILATASPAQDDSKY